MLCLQYTIVPFYTLIIPMLVLFNVLCSQQLLLLGICFTKPQVQLLVVQQLGDV